MKSHRYTTQQTSDSKGCNPTLRKTLAVILWNLSQWKYNLAYLVKFSLDYESIPFQLQVTQEVAQILETKGYTLSCRGTIRVKGKGDMITYFLDKEPTGLGPSCGNGSSPVRLQSLPAPALVVQDQTTSLSTSSNNKHNQELKPLMS